MNQRHSQNISHVCTDVNLSEGYVTPDKKRIMISVSE